MTAAQLVTPISSQLAAVNAIQAAVTASVNWTVNATGTSSAGYKWIEIKPSNVNSLYKDYRIFICERVNYSTGRIAFAGNNTGTSFGLTSNIYIYFAPDGGASGVTFTPANIETASSIYVGTKYYISTGTSHPWHAIASSWTAIWLYECDGAIWIINRAGGTSHQILLLGNICVPAKASQKDFNTSGTEIGVPGALNKTAIASASLSGVFNTSNFYYFYDNNGATPKGCSTTTFSSTSATATVTGPNINGTQVAAQYYEPINAQAGVFQPINFYGLGSVSATSSPLLLRGVYWTANLKTRTTLQTGSPATTIGYTWYPDDTIAPTANVFAFMNTP